MNHYASSMPGEYIPEYGFDADYYLDQHFDHKQQSPVMGAAPQQSIYQSYEEQQAIWHAQNQAAPMAFNRAQTANQPRKLSYQGSTAATRARQTPTNKRAQAPQSQHDSRRTSPTRPRPAKSTKLPQPAPYNAYAAAVPPNSTRSFVPGTKLADQLAVIKARGKKEQPQSTQSAAKTSKRSSGMPYGNRAKVRGRFSPQPQDYSYVAPPPRLDSSAFESRSRTPQNPTQHIQQTQAAAASVSSLRQGQVVDPLQAMRGLDAAPKRSTGELPSGPSPTKERREAETTKPTTTSATHQTQDVSFSIALSKDGLGHFGGIQFWESVDEYLQHWKAVSELHEKAKTFAKWVVYHDRGMQSNGNQNAADEVDKLLYTLFNTQEADHYGGQGVRPTLGCAVLQPETIVRDLEAGITSLLSEDLKHLRELETPTLASVRTLKQDGIGQQIEFYQLGVQALALTVSHIIFGNQDSLIAYATDPRALEAAKRGMEGTCKAVAATHRGTANVSMRFCYMDELKNMISAKLRRFHGLTPEGVNADAARLQAQVAALAELQFQLDNPKVGDVHLAPDLMERTYSYLHEIMCQAHAEFQQIVKNKPQQMTNLGKHPRTSDDTEREKDKEMMPAPASKKQKPTKTPTKNTPPNESRTKDSSSTNQAVAGSRNAKTVRDEDDISIVGERSVLNPASGSTASQMPVQNTATEPSVQGSYTKPCPTISTPESASIPAAAMTKESEGSHSKRNTKYQPGHESGMPDPAAMKQGQKRSIDEVEEKDSIDTQATEKRPRLSSSPGIADQVTPTLEAGYHVVNDGDSTPPLVENLFASHEVLNFDTPIDSHYPSNFGPWDPDLVDNRGVLSHDDWLNAAAIVLDQVHDMQWTYDAGADNYQNV